MATSEIARIERLAKRFGGLSSAQVLVGIGDDAAVLRSPTSGVLVWTVDSQVAGVHFRREWLSMADIGWRSFVAAASDVFAMGAAPSGALSAVTCPDTMTGDDLDSLTVGQSEAAVTLACPVIGGNLSRGPELAITTTVLGTCDRPVLRSHAMVGESVWIAGPVGLAAAGLCALARPVKHRGELDEAIDAFRRPPVHALAGLEIGKLASAAIDVSDGLAMDVNRVAAASGVLVALDEEALIAHAGDGLFRAARALGEDPLELILHGGEDYALVATSAVPIPGFFKIGEVTEGRGMVLRRGDTSREIVPRGFDHFAR